jgi:hypothetical protein
MATRRTGLRTRAANKHAQKGRPTKKKDIKKSGGLRQSSANAPNKRKAAAKKAGVRKTGRAVTGSKTESIAEARSTNYTAARKRGGMTGKLTKEGASPGRGRKGRTPSAKGTESL